LTSLRRDNVVRFVSSPAAWLGALWTFVALADARRSLRRDGLRARVHVPVPLALHIGRGVTGLLAHVDATCLERSLVQQTWLRACGRDVDIVIGVGRDDTSAIGAHAWLAGTWPGTGEHAELIRIPARSTPRSTAW
jgi:hypothetical protein